jgi:hypothetical protein
MTIEEASRGASKAPSIRICILLGKLRDPATAGQALAGEIPRPEYLVLQEALGADLLDYSDVETSTHPFVKAARSRGLGPGLAALGFVRRKEYDQFYCTGEDIAFPFALLMTAAGDFGRITSVIHNAGTNKRRLILRAIPSFVWRNLICLGDEQYRVIVQDGHVRPDVVHLFLQWVDTRFYDPARVTPYEEPRYAFACGRESRDYAMLQRAAAETHIPFHVVASGWSPQRGFSVTSDIQPTPNVVVEGGKLSYVELRRRYAAANVVAVPIKAVTYCAGVTSICESMCMGKPVVVTNSVGIVDYVNEGVSGFIVPVGDATAMRHAIESVWRDPERRAEIGTRNREYAEKHLAVEAYVARVAGLYGMAPQKGPFHG